MTTATEHDPYQTTLGLIDDFDGEIAGAWFGTDPGYNGGQSILLTLDINTDNPDQPQITEKVSVGSGWEVEDQGAAITKSSGRVAFNRSSKAGLWLDHALAAGAGDTMKAKGTPMQASTWEGLKFHFERKPITGFNGEVKDVLLPVTFLGGESGSGSAKASSNGASNGNGSAAVDTPADLDKKTLALLKGAAKKSETHADFIDAAFKIDGVDGNAAAESVVLDEDQFLALKG